MKLSDVHSLNTMVYTDEIPSKHKKRMDIRLNYFENFPIKNFMGNPPSLPSSSQTKKELLQLYNIEVDKSFVEETDNVEKYFDSYMKISELKYSKELIKELMDESGSIILKLKYHYNRPRPDQVANHPLVMVKLKSEKPDTAGSPSYPSGHSAQSRLLANYFSYLYPEHKYNLMALADDVSYARNVGHIHYPSDSKFGIELGDELFSYLIKMRKL